ncbi:hypothetical protein HZQ11_09165 [Elizabethkingia anophelis]|uniref:hypothetical protein n=1 Tax=Elizabethkingia TaxID=308865 RepID=UPI0007399AF7|nr:MULTISPECIES: hypothetical protein [Elizabethkingia]KUF39967.1 hypothetical protein AS358_14815 [Elizabethkingia anophelis]MCT3644904.1 hypothetical protein [Elizabethkingia anophelis]MCT3648726.1 hypothetical protein [Elizabethkingia anophelis]MCT3651262.1 hypothetical protein [Elizabethkingia anophelis]MCT3655669.1 hypothetical protein [Elizabethkingia anophelis]
MNNPPDDIFPLSVKEALIGFYKFNRLNLSKDFSSHCVRVYIGCILAPVPNISARRKYLKFHDIHHIITEYGIDRIGESEVSAWELGSRSCRKPIVSVMNLFALSTGFILSPAKVTSAFYRGCRSRNLYYMAESVSEAEIDAIDFTDIKSGHLEIKQNIKYKFLRQVEFSGYLFISMLIHVFMLIASKALLIAESIKKKIQKRNK